MGSDYAQIAKESRLKVLDLIHSAQTSHVGSVMGAADLFAVLFENIDLDKDKFILSAGWKAALLYYHLWRKGRITEEELNSYNQPGSKWIGLCEPIHPDIPFAGGSVGMGIAAGVARAWSKKQRNEPGRVYVLESDGGMQVGITWEALWFADQHDLNNLTVIIDNNGFQALGRTDGILSMRRLKGKLEQFGCLTVTVNGHDYKDIELAIKLEDMSKPVVIIANTCKGCGVSFMRDNNDWHYRRVDDKNYELAKQELGQ